MNEQEQQAIKSSGIVKGITGVFSKIDRKFIIDGIVVLIAILLFWICLTGIGTPKEVKEALRDNKKLEVKIDSIKLNNDFITSRMYELEKKQTMFFDMVNQNNDLIKENNKELLKLKQIYNDKINSINTYNVSQLDSFFAKRYKNYYNR
jgi:hypothetical protein